MALDFDKIKKLQATVEIEEDEITTEHKLFESHFMDENLKSQTEFTLQRALESAAKDGHTNILVTLIIKKFDENSKYYGGTLYFNHSPIYLRNKVFGDALLGELLYMQNIIYDFLKEEKLKVKKLDIDDICMPDPFEGEFDLVDISMIFD